MNNDDIEVLRYFIIKTLTDFNDIEYNLTFLKFIFREEDMKYIYSFLDTISEDDTYLYFNIPGLDSRVLKEKRDDATRILKNNLLSYKNREDYTFIKIDDYKTFAKLLNEVVKGTYCNNLYYKFSADSILKSIWFRMGVSDIDDVNNFLRRELSFFNTANFFQNEYTKWREYNTCDLVYKNKSNDNFFETNNHIEISLKKYNHYYDFPVIHYGLTIENNLPTCYIYGIQNLEHDNDNYFDEVIKSDKKFLRNKYVSPKFVMSLKLFIDLLRKNNITNIKVPLLQVFNYPYHEKLSNEIIEYFKSYTEEELIDIIDMANLGNDERYNLYLHDKMMYEKFANKQDIISRNKTERLIDTFMVMEEKYNNIKFLTEPFIESDNLIVKIKENKDKVMVK